MNMKHGSPYDRGAADAYYGRPMEPHYYPNGTYNYPLIEKKDMTEEEIEAYRLGYTENEDYKDWR